MKNRIIASFLLAVMLVCCLAGCNGSSDGESSLSGYDALTSNKDKLFYLADRPEYDFGSMDLAAVVGQDNAAIIESFRAAETAKLEGAFDISTAKLDGADYLESVGGALGLELESVSTNLGSNTDLSVKMNGMSIKADIDADKGGVLITAPFVVTKPLYLDLELIKGSLSESGEQSDVFADYEKYVKAFEDYCNGTLTEENLGHIVALLVDSVPEECITSEKVSPEELKGEYITELTETECITLAMDSAQIKTALESLGNKLAEDEVFRSVVTGFIACLPPQLLESFGDEADEESLLPLAAESAESAESTDADALFSELMTSIKGLADDVKEDAFLTVKRYFVNGTSVRFDVRLGNSDEVTELSLWNLVKDDARQYGMTLGDGEECLLSLIGGGNGDGSKTQLSVKGTEKDYGYSNDENGDGEYYTEQKTYYELAAVSVEKKGDKLTATAKVYDDEGKVSFSATLNADCDKGTFVLDGDMGDGDTFGLDGTLVTADGVNTLSGNATLNFEGVRLSVNYTVIVKEGFFSADFVITAKDDDGKTDVALNAHLSLDTKAEVAVEAPATSDKDYVIDSLEDLEGITEILSPFIKNALGGSDGEESL